MSKIATLQEIEEYWSINDLADANEVLDFSQALQASELKKIGTGRK